MQRFPLPKTWFCSAVLTLTVGLGSSLLVTNARADEFSVVPKGDPIYAQLSNLSRPGSNAVAPALTRYEAALQTARIILSLQDGDGVTFSRSNWRAVKALATSLKTELLQLGVDVDVTLALAERNLQNSSTQPDLSLPASKRPKTAPAGGASSVTLPADLMLRPSAIDNSHVKTGDVQIPISQRLRVGAAFSALQRNESDPLRDDFGRRDSSSLSEKSNLKQLGSQTSLAYDVNPNLTVRASSSKIAADPSTLPLMAAPFLDGAGNVSSSGGGVDWSLGGLKLSTELAQLRGDNGATASRIGGGASLSAFQNRLSMSMSLSRLRPEDNAALPSTAAQMGVGLDVTRRLSLSLLYQGLFTESANNNASRFSGGFSLNF